MDLLSFEAIEKFFPIIGGIGVVNKNSIKLSSFSNVLRVGLSFTTLLLDLLVKSYQKNE